MSYDDGVPPPFGATDDDPRFVAALIALIMNLMDPDINDIEAFDAILPSLMKADRLDFELLVEVVNQVRAESISPATGVWQ